MSVLMREAMCSASSTSDSAAYSSINSPSGRPVHSDFFFLWVFAVMRAFAARRMVLVDR